MCKRYRQNSDDSVWYEIFVVKYHIFSEILTFRSYTVDIMSPTSIPFQMVVTSPFHGRGRTTSLHTLNYKNSFIKLDVSKDFGLFQLVKKF